MKNEMASEVMKGTLQFTNEVEINAPKNLVWKFATDSKKMEIWSEFVPRVEVLLSEGQVLESLGSERKVDVIFGKKTGYFLERRIMHEEESKIAYHIYEDTVGFKKFLKEASFLIELFSIDNNRTKLCWSFYQTPNGFLGWLVHPMFKRTQRKGNKQGLESLKNLIESNYNIEI